MKLVNNLNAGLKTIQIIYIALLAAILIYAVILIQLSSSGIATSPFPEWDISFTGLAVVFGFISVYSLMEGYYLPQRILKRGKSNPVNALIVRCTLFESVAIFGFVLGVLGAGWIISLPFFVVAAVALILTFPTSARWQKMIELNKKI
jgi:hypothetical protein